VTLRTKAALIVSVAGVLAGLFVAMRARNLRAGVSVMLALWTAATLLRLSANASWPALGAAATLVSFRKLVGNALRD
jgi:hypothetical protein